MLFLLTGTGIVVGAIAGAYTVSPRNGPQVERSEWIDISIALALTATIMGGVALAAAGVNSLL